MNERPFITHLSCIEFFPFVNVLSTGCAPKNIIICKLIMLVDYSKTDTCIQLLHLQTVSMIVLKSLTETLGLITQFHTSSPSHVRYKATCHGVVTLHLSGIPRSILVRLNPLTPNIK